MKGRIWKNQRRFPLTQAIGIVIISYLAYKNFRYCLDLYKSKPLPKSPSITMVKAIDINNDLSLKCLKKISLGTILECFEKTPYIKPKPQYGRIPLGVLPEISTLDYLYQSNFKTCIIEDDTSDTETVRPGSPDVPDTCLVQGAMSQKEKAKPLTIELNERVDESWFHKANPPALPSTSSVVSGNWEGEVKKIKYLPFDAYSTSRPIIPCNWYGPIRIQGRQIQDTRSLPSWIDRGSAHFVHPRLARHFFNFASCRNSSFVRSDSLLLGELITYPQLWPIVKMWPRVQITGTNATITWLPFKPCIGWLHYQVIPFMLNEYGKWVGYIAGYPTTHIKFTTEPLLPKSKWAGGLLVSLPYQYLKKVYEDAKGIGFAPHPLTKAETWQTNFSPNELNRKINLAVDLSITPKGKISIKDKPKTK